MASASIPIKLLHEGEGHPVIVELTTGEVYRGQLDEAEPNMNCHLSAVTARSKSGKVARMDHVFLRGSAVRFIVLPDMLKNAPLFKRVEEAKERVEAAEAERAAAAKKRKSIYKPT